MATFRHVLTASVLVAASAATVAGCGVEPGDVGMVEGAPQAFATRKQVAVPPNVDSAVWFDAPANAACMLTVGADATQVHANSEGQVVVYVKPARASEQAEEILLECEQRSQILELHAVEGAVAAPVPRPAAREIIPALTAETAASLSNAYLVTHGYPRRPDAKKYPEAYAKWLVDVSRAYEVVDPAPREGKRKSTFTAGTSSASWSGTVLTGSTGLMMNYVYGYWNQPSVAAIDNGATMSEWIGIDGYGLPDLFQAGTSAWVATTGGGTLVSKYNVWHEVLPESGLNWTGMTVAPGNAVRFAVEVSPSLPYVNVTMNFWNDSLGTHSTIQKQYDTANTYGWNGRTVEWIIENPSTGSAGTDMANFGGPVKMAGWGGMDSGTIEDWYTPNGNCLFAGGCETWVYVTPQNFDGKNDATGHTLVDSWEGVSGGTDYVFFQWKNYN